MTAASIECRLRERPDPDGKGVFCRFYRLSKRRGVKLYSCRQARDNCFHFQALLHKYGLAPKVYRRLDLSCAWAYETAVAERVSDKRPSGHLGQLDAALKCIGVCYNDMHYANVGYIGRALVLIDCDPAFATRYGGLVNILNE